MSTKRVVRLSKRLARRNATPKEAVLDAARKLCFAEGVDGVSARKIARLAQQIPEPLLAQGAIEVARLGEMLGGVGQCLRDATLPSAGIPYVVVAGKIVVDSGRVTKARPGRAIRAPVRPPAA